MGHPAVVAVVLSALSVLAGCGSSSPPGSLVPTVTVALDFVPNAVHAPIYAAMRSGADRRHRVRIAIERPGSQPDSLKALLVGRADVGVLDIQDLGIARLAGRDVVGIAALVQRPLSALVAEPSVRRPRELEGRTVGVSGLPSDPAFVDAIVRHDGGDPGRVRQVTIGFEAVSALLSGKVAAVPAFWNAEGVTLRRKGLAVREFKVDDYGAPPFPEVLLVTTRSRLSARRDALRRFVAAVQDGTRAVRAHPDAAAAEVARASGTTDTGLIRAQLAAVAPIADPSLRLNRRALERWARFAARIGILRGRPDVGTAFDFSLTR